MYSAVRTVSFDCHDPYALARFWSGVVGQPVHSDDNPGDPQCSVVMLDGHPDLLFLTVPEGKSVKNRVHLDLTPNGSRDEEVDRVVAAGATIVSDMRRPDGRGWVVLGDPEGNEFCILRSAAERAATAHLDEAAWQAEQAAGG